ncbi:MAG: ABC transporter substrate-binding protein, partial [Verrucomicrobia bacterium]|nr:ABC transporter substrate-binding protein [Verrucomicrobiota bacterium]
MVILILLSAYLFSPGAVRSQSITIAGDADQGDQGPWMKAKVEEFSKQTGINVRYIGRPLSTTETLMLWQQDWAAQTADVGVYLIDVIWPAIAAPHAEDLSKYFTSQEVAEFFPRIVENNTVNGKLVAIPFFTDAGLLYYRSDLLEKYGFKNPPNTWSELQNMAQKIQDGERANDKDFYGFLFQGASYEGLTCNGLEWIASNGGGHIVESDGKVSINNPQTKSILKTVARWVGTISPKGATTYQEEESRNAFQEGHAAFLRNWPYVYALANGKDSQVKGHVDVTSLPQGDGPNASHAATLGGWQLMLSKYSKNKDAAAKLIKYFVSFETQKDNAIKLTRLPTRPALYEDKDVLAVAPWFSRLRPVF